MNIILYTLMAYGLTAVISLAVVAIIVILGKTVGKNKDEEESAENV